MNLASRSLVIRPMNANLALSSPCAGGPIRSHASKSHAQPEILHDAGLPSVHFSAVEESFFADGVALSERHAAEADELARLGRVAPVQKVSWWRRLFARRRRFAPAMLAWD